MSPTERLEAFLQRMPYTGFLGMDARLDDDGMTAVLPFSRMLIGNPSGPSLHGGVLAAFLELTALAQLSLTAPSERPHRTVDVTVDYLRPGREQPTYARAEVRKLGRRFANLQVEAWQDRRDKPVALLHGHFMLAGD